ncbi:hypothetical protein D9M68_940250 [compost metagenome]
MSLPPLSDVSSKYGAPMGRRNRCEMLPDEVGKVYLQRVPFVDGCYDQGGAYWGAPANLWRAYCEMEITEGEIDVFEQFLRAGTREQAKAALRDEFPNISFYR